MFEDDFFSKYSSTTTTSEETSQETYRPQTSYQTTQSYDDDQDYSITQNFTEQKSYNSVSQDTFEEEEQEQVFETPSLNAPVIIQKSEPTVNLVKKRAKLVLETRMKTVVAVFAMIVACLLFVSIFNFIQVGKIESTCADKQLEIAALENSISSSKATYTLVSEEEYLRQWAETNEFVEADDTNTIVVDLSQFYTEPAGPEEIPSNWFNDVCEFLSRLFA
jgi:hypothetical protein